MHILGFSGKKQSGKNTCGNYVFAWEMMGLGLIEREFKILEDGKIWVSDVLGDSNHEGIFDPTRNTESMYYFLEKYVHPYVKMYSFADLLKQAVCMEILGLTYEQMYTEEGKEEYTQFKFEDFPLDLKRKGNMRCRDLLQVIGTEFFRGFYDDVWAKCTIRRILNEGTELAIVTDVRFPNEVQVIQDAGGKVLRLTRNQSSLDKHKSETALNPDKFDWEKFDAVLDNEHMTIGDQNFKIKQLLTDWQYPGFVATQENVYKLNPDKK